MTIILGLGNWIHEERFLVESRGNQIWQNKLNEAEIFTHTPPHSWIERRANKQWSKLEFLTDSCSANTMKILLSGILPMANTT